MGGRLGDVWNDWSDLSGEIARPRFLPMDEIVGIKLGMDWLRRCSRKALEADEKVANFEVGDDEPEADGGGGRDNGEPNGAGLVSSVCE